MTFKYFKREYELSKLMDQPLSEDVQPIIDLFEYFYYKTDQKDPYLYYSKENLPTLSIEVSNSYTVNVVYIAMKYKIGGTMDKYDFIQIVHYLFSELKGIELGHLSVVTRVE